MPEPCATASISDTVSSPKERDGDLPAHRTVVAPSGLHRSRKSNVVPISSPRPPGVMMAFQSWLNGLLPVSNGVVVLRSPAEAFECRATSCPILDRAPPGLETFPTHLALFTSFLRSPFQHTRCRSGLHWIEAIKSSCQRSVSHLALMGFRPLQRVARGKRPTPGLPRPAARRSQVFSTSQRFTPPLDVPALFHAGSTHGVWDPTERSPSSDRVASQLPFPS
jgi:hypothetical protein